MNIKTIKQLKMKTILNLKQYMLLLVAAFAMTSCLDSDDPDFQILGSGYIQQTIISDGSTENTEDTEDPTIISKFTPIIAASAYYGTINSCDVTSPSGSKIAMTQLTSNPYLWVTNTAYSSGSSTLPRGTFQISATDPEGATSSLPISINNTTEMETKLVGDIKFENNTITATFNEVKNATNYQVILKPKKSSVYFESLTIASYSASELKNADWKVSINESTYSTKTQAIAEGTYVLAIAATINYSNSILLYQESNTAYADFTK